MNDITIRFLDVYNYLLKDKQVSNPSHFAKMIEISTSTMNEILKGRSNAGINPIQNTVKNFTEINAEWLLTGAGNTIKKGNSVIENTIEEQNITDELKDKTDLIKFQRKKIEDLEKEILKLKKDKEASESHLYVAEPKPEMKKEYKK